MTILADGTDGGGSIRIPASVNGVFGYKPPFGRNPLDASHAGETLLHYGPITRSVVDAALMQNVMSGPHTDDICSLREKLELPSTFEGIEGWKVGFTMDFGFMEVDKEVQKNTMAAVEVFESLGCTVDKVDFNWNPGSRDAWLTRWEGMFAASLEHLLPRWRFDLDPGLLRLIERGKALSSTRYYKTDEICREMYRTLGPLLEKYDVVICPTTAVPAVKADHDELDPSFSINGKPIPLGLGWAMTNPFNLLSQCPVASIPTGFASSGVPTGMQIIARTFDDLRVFRASAAFERAKPWQHLRPSFVKS
jgi:amidase